MMVKELLPGDVRVFEQDLLNAALYGLSAFLSAFAALAIITRRNRSLGIR